MTNKKTSKNGDTKKVDTSDVAKYATIGVSLAGIAAGAYFFFGPKGKKHQKHAKAWVIKMKGDVVEKLEKAKEVTEPIYEAIIDKVGAEYSKKIKNGQEDIAEIVGDLKKQWKNLHSAIQPKPKAKLTAKGKGGGKSKGV